MKRVVFATIFSGLLSGLSPSMMTAATMSGQEIFNRNCSLCHSVAPPPKAAPPIIPLSNRYHLQFRTKIEGVNQIVAYLKAPRKAKAVDPQAITRFGLMPPLRLPDAELRVVAEWVWDQYNPNMGMGRGMGMGQGRGRAR
ncbi:MAG: cytochrome c [Chlorobiaceae bacterium]|nr:cytochrome c [Chlorobiaceae bacterium]